MKRIYLIIAGFFLLSLNSCLNSQFSEMEQIYPNWDLSKVKSIEMYDYTTKRTTTITNPVRVKWYTEFLKDSTNYYKEESISNEKGTKPLYGLMCISEKDTLSLSVYSSGLKNKIVIGFFDTYNSEEPNKFLRYNRFYLNNRIEDSIINIFK